MKKNAPNSKRDETLSSENDKNRENDAPKTTAEASTAETSKVEEEKTAELKDAQESLPPPEKETSLTLKMSQALKKRLIEKSHDEGISVEAFAAELLTEGLISRIWELRDKRPGPQQGHQGHQGHYQGSNQRHNDRQHHGNKPPHRRGGRDQYFNIMDDKASFIDYVRNLDKKKR